MQLAACGSTFLNNSPGSRRHVALDHLLNVARLKGFLCDPADNILKVVPTMLANKIGQAGQLAGLSIALSLLELQEIEADQGDCEPLVSSFEALQAKIGDA